MRFSCWSFCFDCWQLPRRNAPWAEICVWICGLLPWNDLDKEAWQIFTACNLVAPYNETSPLQGFQCFSATARTVDLKSCRFVFLWGDSKLSKVWKMQKNLGGFYLALVPCSGIALSKNLGAQHACLFVGVRAYHLPFAAVLHTSSCQSDASGWSGTEDISETARHLDPAEMTVKQRPNRQVSPMGSNANKKKTSRNSIYIYYR